MVSFPGAKRPVHSHEDISREGLLSKAPRSPEDKASVNSPGKISLEENVVLEDKLRTQLLLEAREDPHGHVHPPRKDVLEVDTLCAWAMVSCGFFFSFTQVAIFVH